MARELPRFNFSVLTNLNLPSHHPVHYRPGKPTDNILSRHHTHVQRNMGCTIFIRTVWGIVDSWLGLSVDIKIR